MCEKEVVRPVAMGGRKIAETVREVCILTAWMAAVLLLPVPCSCCPDEEDGMYGSYGTLDAISEHVCCER